MKKRLTETYGANIASKILRLIQGKSDHRTFPSVQKWLAQCHNEPARPELIMEAINELTGGHGVEAIRGRYVSRYYQDIQAVYVNQGDTYDSTILLDNETGRYMLTSWGDWYERNEKRRQLS